MGKKTIISCLVFLAVGGNLGCSSASLKEAASSFKARVSKARTVASHLGSKVVAPIFTQADQYPGEINAHRLQRDVGHDHKNDAGYDDDEIDAELGARAAHRDHVPAEDVHSPEAHYGAPGAEEIIPEEEEEPLPLPESEEEKHPHPSPPPHVVEHKHGAVIVNVVTVPSPAQPPVYLPPPEPVREAALPQIVPERQAQENPVAIQPPQQDLSPLVEAIKELQNSKAAAPVAAPAQPVVITPPSAASPPEHKIHIENNNCSCGCGDNSGDYARETALWKRVEDASVKLEAIEEVTPPPAKV